MEPTFSILEIECLERPVILRLPFRFGAVTVTHAPQAFVRARIGLGDGREAWGAAAELMVPKWFDKDPRLDEAQSFDQLRSSLWLAREAYLDDQLPRTAFGHFAAHYAEHLEAGARRGLPSLAAGFGPAEIDKALLDALARALGVPFGTMIRNNLVGIAPAALLPEFADFDFARFLASLTPRSVLTVRHTVGMLDRIAGHPGMLDDGLPESLEEAIHAYDLRRFKIKLCGREEEDLLRLFEIAELLDHTVPDYRVTLDGNEQYNDLDSLGALWSGLGRSAPLMRLRERTLFIEQPVSRGVALVRDVRTLSSMVPLIIDESDAALDAFPKACTLGYTGVSSKACKGLYKALINRARCQQWNRGKDGEIFFMSAEDLTTQAGLALQQDLALCGILGMTHVERNGHHYVDGFAGQGASVTEQDAFLAAHSDLYHRSREAVRVKLCGGCIDIASLDVAGFASAVFPDWASMSPMPIPDQHAVSELQGMQ
ncbi:MAG: mandelate racemase [Betaproteobacteria bacterium]